MAQDSIKLAKHEIHQTLTNNGFKCIGFPYSMNSSDAANYINRDNFQYVHINWEDLDMEDFFNVLGTSEEEISKIIEARNKTAVPYTDEEMQKKFDWEDEDFKAVIREIIDREEVKEDGSEC